MSSGSGWYGGMISGVRAQIFEVPKPSWLGIQICIVEEAGGIFLVDSIPLGRIVQNKKPKRTDGEDLRVTPVRWFRIRGRQTVGWWAGGGDQASF